MIDSVAYDVLLKLRLDESRAGNALLQIWDQERRLSRLRVQTAAVVTEAERFRAGMCDETAVRDAVEAFTDALCQGEVRGIESGGFGDPVDRDVYCVTVAISGPEFRMQGTLKTRTIADFFREVGNGMVARFKVGVLEAYRRWARQ